MSNKVTTAGAGFIVEDCTFRSTRFQSEVLKEVESSIDPVSEDIIKAPNSLTPEQVKKFYLECVSNTHDMVRKRVYMQTIQWIDELFEFKKKELNRKIKEMNTQDTSTVDDIQ